MFQLNHKTEIMIKGIPIQWIPKIELYYPDLPQFPIMYIHAHINNNRLVACPVSVSYEIIQDKCNAKFLVFTNLEPVAEVVDKIKDEIENRIGFSNPINKQTVIDCCKGNSEFINILTDLWQYIEKSYGPSIPYGRFYEEMFSIPRFVAAWQPKTGRQSEMRMLYNFMSKFGEEVSFPSDWNHLEYYIIPSYTDVINKDYTNFPNFKKLYSAMKKIFELDFSNSITIDDVAFKVMPRAWEKNKEEFIKNVSGKYYSTGDLTETDKYYSEILVDAFNRHPWRAAFFISAFMNIENSDYRTWNKNFFNTFYSNDSKLKGYSEKVIACFLQQGFENEEIIPVDTWIETFYKFPLGINNKSDFFNSFDMLGKLERVIWLASQSNKTNMKNFFDILWCQRYGTIGNSELRGVNPLACSLCSLSATCVGLSKIKNECVLISNTLKPEEFDTLPSSTLDCISFICLLEDDVPKKIYSYKQRSHEWVLNDEFSGYLKTKEDNFPKSLVSKEIITVEEFINNN